MKRSVVTIKWRQTMRKSNMFFVMLSEISISELAKLVAG